MRELRNMLEQVVLMAQDDAINVEQLTFSLCRVRDEKTRATDLSGVAAEPGARSTPKAEAMEVDRVAQTLEKTDWNISKSAKLLGLSRDMLRYRIEKYRFARPN